MSQTEIIKLIIATPLAIIGLVLLGTIICLYLFRECYEGLSSELTILHRKRWSLLLNLLKYPLDDHKLCWKAFWRMKIAFVLSLYVIFFFVCASLIYDFLTVIVFSICILGFCLGLYISIYHINSDPDDDNPDEIRIFDDDGDEIHNCFYGLPPQEHDTEFGDDE